jgi:hypothetical protein
MEGEAIGSLIAENIDYKQDTCFETQFPLPAFDALRLTLQYESTHCIAPYGQPMQKGFHPLE